MEELRLLKSNKGLLYTPDLACGFFKLISYIFQRESDKSILPPSFPDYPASHTTVKESIGRQIPVLINTLTVIKQTGLKIPFSGSEKPHH